MRSYVKQNGGPAMKKTALLLLFFFIIKLTNAQERADTLWKTGFDNEKVNFGMLLPDGAPLLYSDMGSLYCLEPGNGAVRWRSGVGTITPNTKFSFFPGTPYIQVNGYVINPIDGQQMPLGSQAKTKNGQSIEVKATYIFPEQQVLLAYGKLEKDEVFAMIDLLSGKTKWSRTDMFKNTDANAAKPAKKGFGALMKEVGSQVMKEELQAFEDDKNPGERFLANPVALKKGQMLIPLNLGLYNIDVATGNVIWKKDYPVKKKGAITVKSGDATTVLGLNADSSIVYVGRTDWIEAVNISNGTALWPEPKPAAGPTGFLSITDDGLLSLPSSKDATLLQNKKISLFNKDNGDVKWEISMKPGVKGYMRTGDIVVLNLLTPGNKEKINAFSVKDGKMLFPKDLDVDGTVLNMRALQNGVLVMSDEHLFIIDKAGNYLGDKVSKSKKDNWIVTQDGSSAYFTYSGSSDVYRINMADNKVTKLQTGDLKFQGKENIGNLEMYNNNLLLSSEQNLVSLKTDSYQPLYQKYYKAPGKTAVGKIISGAQSLKAFTTSLLSATSTIAGAMVSTALVASDEGQSFIQMYPKESNEIIGGLLDATVEQGKETVSNFKDAGNYLREINRRFKATKNAQDFQYLLSTDEQGDLSILQVKKSDGQVAATVRLRKNDKSPNYLVDEAGKKLYYIPRVTQLDETIAVFSNELSKIICLNLN